METNAIELKRIETEIKQWEKQLKMDSGFMETAEKAVNIESSRLHSKGFSTQEIKEVVDFGKKAYDETLSIEERAKAQAMVTSYQNVYTPNLDRLLSYLQEYIRRSNDVEQCNTTLAKLRQEKEQLKTKKEEKKVTENTVPEVEGHLYPVKMVVKWTEKLDFWNAELDKFIEKIEQTDINIDITWLCKKCEWICRKINYALAVLRYEIIKVLGSLYKQVQDYLPMLEVVTKIPSLTTVVSWAKGIINLFLGPYKVLIQFIQDFMTYTPPLISSAASLVGKTASIPPLILSRVNIVAQDKESGEQKEIAEVYKQYMKIEMEPITLADIMGGADGIKKPAVAEFTGNKKQYEMLENKLDVNEVKLINTWQTFQEQLKQATQQANIENLPWIQAQYCDRINFIAKDNFDEYYIEGGYNCVKSEMETASIVYEMIKERERAEKAKQKAIDKARQAQNKAKKAKQAADKRDKAAAAHILDDDIIEQARQAQADAEQAQAEANAAMREAESMGTFVEVPWGKYFNSTRFPVYPIVTTRSFAGIATGGEAFAGLFEELQEHYYNMYAPKGKIKKIRPELISFMMSFVPAYPFIEPCLNKIKDLTKERIEITQQASDLNKRSIFK